MSVVLAIHPGESEVIAFDYVDAMPLGAEEVDEAVLEAHEWVNGKQGDDVTDDFLLDENGTISGTQVRFQFNDPAEFVGKRIRVKTQTTFDDGQVKVNRIFFEVTPA